MADTLPPIATESDGTPTNDAYAARARRTGSSNAGTSMVPACHAAMQPLSSSTRNVGGSP